MSFNINCGYSVDWFRQKSETGAINTLREMRQVFKKVRTNLDSIKQSMQVSRMNLCRIVMLIWCITEEQTIKFNTDDSCSRHRSGDIVDVHVS